MRIIYVEGLCLLLLIASIEDIRHQRINPYWLLLHACFVVVVRLILGEFLTGLAGVSIGLLLLGAAFVSRQKVGYGDGLVFMVCGLYLGFWENFSLLFMSLVLCALGGLFLMLIGKIKKGQTLPFIPFVMAAFACAMVFEAVG
ncbi:MAG: prepilin peptidase [Lachnospiraceae bacterium]|nr:prepilin peptidase [Lachnospiraceae bacterium]